MEVMTRKTEEIAPIFGLRYLEEEDAEINGIAGCNVPLQERFIDDGSGSTHYTTNCDYPDYD